ncbi:MAG: nuclear transport factor 2 family protein [Chloroflexota bacterium]
MSDPVHERVMRTMADVISNGDWERFGEVFHDDGILEYPQSREVFRGLANITGQFASYPELGTGTGTGTSELHEIIGATTYAMTPSYTVIAVKGSGDHGTAVVRVQYPDGSWWWVLNLYELDGERIRRSRAYFAPDFEAPDWRAPYREPL